MRPDNAFVMQALRGLAGDSDILRAGRFLICDRDPKWSGAVVSFLEGEGVRVIRTPARAPNCSAYAERFVRSIKEECLDRLLVLGERHLRRASGEFVAHCHGERNHHGLGNELIQPVGPISDVGSCARRQRMGGMLNYYYRAA